MTDPQRALDAARPFDPSKPVMTRDGREARIMLSPCTRFLAGSVDGKRENWRLDGTHEVSGALDLFSAPAQPDASEGDEVVRCATGESVLGFEVAAYRSTHSEHGDRFGYTFATHWSTPTKHRSVVTERLFTEAQLRDALARSARTRAPGTDAGEAQPVAYGSFHGNDLVAVGIDKKYAALLGAAEPLYRAPSPASLNAGLARAVEEVVKREERYLTDAVSNANDEDGPGIMPGDVTGSFHRIFTALRAATSNGGSRTFERREGDRDAGAQANDITAIDLDREFGRRR